MRQKAMIALGLHLIGIKSRSSLEPQLTNSRIVQEQQCLETEEQFR
jgi:hypothetical protein